MSEFTLSYRGNEASDGEIDFYDVANAMVGFQRSLALTTHLVQNGEIIVQAPSLKNARILAIPPRLGSWEVIAGVAVTAAGGYALASTDSDVSRLTRRVYDYVLRSILGDDVDYHEEFKSQPHSLINGAPITESKLDSLIEKSERAVVEMHRPIVWSGTASSARIYANGNKDMRVGPRLSPDSFEHANRTVELKTPEEFIGKISSYNSNTFKGRVFIPELGRPIPFELAEETRGRKVVSEVTASLRSNALDRSNSTADVWMKAFKRESSQGRVKGLYVVELAPHII